MDVAEPDGNAANVQQYFAKYLTSQNLLELQLGDSNFRRYILLQFLIMFQYLDSPVKFKQCAFFILYYYMNFYNFDFWCRDSQKLNEDQNNWVTNVTEQVYKLLEDTPPDGKAFSQAIRHILKREELWSNWKNEGCPEFKPSISLQIVDAPQDGGAKTLVTATGRPRTRGKRPLGETIRESIRRNKCIIGKYVFFSIMYIFSLSTSFCFLVLS